MLFYDIIFRKNVLKLVELSLAASLALLYNLHFR